MKELNKTQILLVVVILLQVAYIIMPKSVPISDNRLQLSIDSMRVHDRQKDSLIQVLMIHYAQSELRVDGIQRQLLQVPDMINNIKRTYDKKRVYIDTASDADQGRFFSEWTAKEDQ